MSGAPTVPSGGTVAPMLLPGRVCISLHRVPGQRVRPCTNPLPSCLQLPSPGAPGGPCLPFIACTPMCPSTPAPGAKLFPLLRVWHRSGLRIWGSAGGHRKDIAKVEKVVLLPSSHGPGLVGQSHRSEQEPPWQGTFVPHTRRLHAHCAPVPLHGCWCAPTGTAAS